MLLVSKLDQESRWMRQRPEILLDFIIMGLSKLETRSRRESSSDLLGYLILRLNYLKEFV